MSIYITIHTKEKGKQELTEKEWYEIDISSLTYHREDGPAIEWNGTKYWHIKGKLHREDGPAIEYYSGEKQWYVNNKRHREDGPAIEFTDGSQAWYINGEQISFKQWFEKTKQPKEDLAIYLVDPSKEIRKQANELFKKMI